MPTNDLRRTTPFSVFVRPDRALIVVQSQVDLIWEL